MVAMDTGLEQLCLFLQMANTYSGPHLLNPPSALTSSQFQGQGHFSDPVCPLHRPPTFTSKKCVRERTEGRLYSFPVQFDIPNDKVVLEM